MVCLLIDRDEPIIRRFGTTTQQLLLLRDWLIEHRIKHVAMESPASTGTDLEHSGRRL